MPISVPVIRACTEAAVNAGISLANADLSFADLTNASLDGGDFRHARLEGASCAGANLSECDFTGANLRNGDFSHACLAEARLLTVDFTNSHFGQTILTGAIVDGCIFTCPTALALPFSDVATLGLNSYRHGSGVTLSFTACPIVITGLPQRLVFLGEATLIGARLVRKSPGSVALFNDFLRAHLGEGPLAGLQ